MELEEGSEDLNWLEAHEMAFLAYDPKAYSIISSERPTCDRPEGPWIPPFHDPKIATIGCTQQKCYVKYVGHSRLDLDPQDTRTLEMPGHEDPRNIVWVCRTAGKHHAQLTNGNQHR